MYEDVLYFGGSGYILSSAAMEALEAMTPNINQDFKSDAVAEDVAMGICMAKVATATATATASDGEGEGHIRQLGWLENANAVDTVAAAGDGWR